LGLPYTLCYRFERAVSSSTTRPDLDAALRNAQPRAASSDASTAAPSCYGLARARTANANYATFGQSLADPRVRQSRYHCHLRHRYDFTGLGTNHGEAKNSVITIPDKRAFMKP
jgi:hypothetical protein